jgi:predicted RNase H-like HicB family nuclease
LKDRLAAIEDAAILGTFTLHVETFASEPYKVKRPIPLSLQRRTDGYIASFVEANVNSSGDTQQEALANVKELILDAFDSLSSMPTSKLGPGPARQLAVLREFIDVAPDHERACEQDREEAEGEGKQVS